MARNDLDDYKDTEVEAKTAQEAVAVDGPDGLAADNAAAAQAAGVRRASFIDYDEALTNYTAREDIEGLAARATRERPDSFADADWIRAAAGTASASEPQDS
jgi:hypothetical protein